MAPTFGNKNAAISKREKFKWSSPKTPGVFMSIEKALLNIEGDYQRTEHSKAKVLEIARDWDWCLVGVIIIFMREDGSFWVIDGGHRVRGAYLRDDITHLPCMVFVAASIEDEAKAFIGANNMRNPVSAYHKHRAAVLAKEPIAMAAQAILDKYGYFPSQSASAKFGFSAIKALHSQVSEDRGLAERVFAACASIAQDGEQISGVVLDAIFHCHKKLNGKADILSGWYVERLKRETLPGIEAVIRREKHILGGGGVAVAAKALLDLLNKGKQRRLKFS